MSRRPGFRFILLDLAIVLSLVLVGWATYRLMRIEPQISSERRQSEALQQIFKEAQRLFKEGTNDLELARRELDLFWYDALLLKNEYLGLAEHLESSLPAFRKSLNNLAEGKSELTPGLLELQSWIAKEGERVS